MVKAAYLQKLKPQNYFPCTVYVSNNNNEALMYSNCNNYQAHIIEMNYLSQQFSGWLSTDDPYRTVHAPYSIRPSAHFHLLWWSIIKYYGCISAGKFAQFEHFLGGSLANLAFENDCYVLSKNCLSLGTRLNRQYTRSFWSSNIAFKIEGETITCPATADVSKRTRWLIAKACVKQLKASSWRCMRYSSGVVDGLPTCKQIGSTTVFLMW